MLNEKLFIVRCICCICCFPALVAIAVFLLCYSPVYYLFSMFTPSEDKAELKTILTSKLRKPGMARLEVKHV